MKIVWWHLDDDEPRFIYSEIDDESYELRKVEIYQDSSFGVASKDFAFGGTVLLETQVPDIESIADGLEYVPKAIERDEFNAIWLGCIHFLRDDGFNYRRWTR